MILFGEISITSNKKIFHIDFFRKKTNLPIIRQVVFEGEVFESVHERKLRNRERSVLYLRIVMTSTRFSLPTSRRNNERWVCAYLSLSLYIFTRERERIWNIFFLLRSLLSAQDLYVFFKVLKFGLLYKNLCTRAKPGRVAKLFYNKT